MVILLLLVCVVFHFLDDSGARLLPRVVVRDTKAFFDSKTPSAACWESVIPDQGVSCVWTLKSLLQSQRRSRQKHRGRTSQVQQANEGQIPFRLSFTATARSPGTKPLALCSGGALCCCHDISLRQNPDAFLSKLQHRCCRRRGSACSSSISSSRTSSSNTRTTRCICELQTGDGEFASPAEAPLILRFAPSPTGSLHVGGARTALVNFALLQEHLSHARRSKNLSGRLILRIEDTDEVRNNVDSEKSLIKDLKWLGIKWDEGPDVGGPSGFYRQSERLSIYRHHGRELLKRNILYRCFCSKERLALLRQERTQQGLPPRYDGRCRSVTPAEAERLAAEKRPFALRIPSAPRTISFHDGLRGLVTFSLQKTLGDFVCFRPANKHAFGSTAGAEPQTKAGSSDSSVVAATRREDDTAFGNPVYNFCAAVDDWLMGVTAVVRGEEHIPNTVAQILLAHALGAPIPRFCHLPVMLAKEGGKISKRKQLSDCAFEATSSSSKDRRPHSCSTSSATTAGWKAAPREAASSSTLSDYTIQGLRMRGYHPEAVVSCLRGHHLEGVQMAGHLSNLAQLRRGSFCFDEQHLLYAHKRKIMQLAESNNAEPLVQFFCEVLSMAPVVSDSEAHFAKKVALASKTTKELPPGNCGECIATMREEQPWLFEFISLAARLLLPQHVAPPVVAKEFVENLRGRIQPGSEAIERLLRSNTSEAQQFRLVAAALVASRDAFEASSEENCSEYSSLLEQESGKMPKERLTLLRSQGGVMMTFEAWIEQLSKQLNMEKPKLMRLARVALTGRDVGVPLGKLLQLLRVAQLAGLPACPSNDSPCFEAQPQHTKDAHSHLLCLDWLRKQWYRPLSERLSQKFVALSPDMASRFRSTWAIALTRF
ncbi:hypothetical protein Esti_000234 [Eimeria stiedai]